MALKNMEEDIVHKIQRAISKELKRLRRQSPRTGEGHAPSATLARQTETMTSVYPDDAIDLARGPAAADSVRSR